MAGLLVYMIYGCCLRWFGWFVLLFRLVGGCPAVVVGCLQVALGFVSGFDLVLAVF